MAKKTKQEYQEAVAILRGLVGTKIFRADHPEALQALEKIDRCGGEWRQESGNHSIPFKQKFSLCGETAHNLVLWRSTHSWRHLASHQRDPVLSNGFLHECNLENHSTDFLLKTPIW